MGMILYVYRNSEILGDCTNNGITNQHSRLCVTNVEGPFNPDENTPAVKLVRGNLPETVHVVPEGLDDKHKMMGGNYAGTCDSRWSRAIEKITGHRFYGAVAVHDRIED